MANSDERIPVTEERWKQLNELKAEGETYDDLLGTLIQAHQRRRLVDRAKEVHEADSRDLISLDEV